MSDSDTPRPPGLSLADYQRLASRTTNASLSADQRLLDATAGLAEEAGEVLGLVRKHLFMHHDLDTERMATELGDALWCLTAAAGALGLSLEDVAAQNLAKLRRRYPDGYSDDASLTSR
jgi:NTP pyrophosphatase (non-canonical NTP hydrolase)